MEYIIKHPFPTLHRGIKGIQYFFICPFSVLLHTIVSNLRGKVPLRAQNYEIKSNPVYETPWKCSVSQKKERMGMVGGIERCNQPAGHTLKAESAYTLV